MAVVDGGGYFEIVVEVLRHITFADTTFEIGVEGVGLKHSVFGFLRTLSCSHETYRSRD